MASNTAEARYTSHQVASWLKETMKLPSTKDVGVKQLSSSFLPACKGSNMIAFWNSMMTQFRPAEEVENIKRNIELDNHKNRHGELVAELEHKRRKLRALQDERDSLMLQVRNKKEEVQYFNQQVKESQELKKKMQIKDHLYKSYTDLLDDQVLSCKAYLDWITELKDTYKENRNPDSTFSNAVKSARCVIKDSICGNEGDRKNLFPLVGDLVKNFSPQVIISALTEITKDSAKAIQSDVHVFNIENELAEIQDKIQKGSVSYGTFSGTTLKGMLEKWDRDCVKRYFEVLEKEQTYREKLKTATDIRENIIRLLKLQYEFEPTKLQLAIDDLDAEAEIMAAKSCHSSFQSAKAELKEKIQEGTKTQQDAAALREKISASSKVVREDQEKITQTLKRNSSLAASLLGHQQEVQSYGESAVCSKQADVMKCCTNACIVFQEHLSAFNHADMDRLRQVETGEGIGPLKNLSILRYNDISEVNGKFSYQKTMCCLGINGHLPPSAVLQRIHETRSKIERLKVFEALVDEADVANSLVQLRAIEQLCKEADMKIFEKLHPKYKVGIEVADHAKERCANLEGTIKVWYDQPAQHQVPWLTLHGMTLQEWKEKKHHV